MGTSIDVLILSDDAVGGKAAIDAALKEMIRIENMMSEWKPASELSKVNDSAGEDPVKVSPELYALIKHSIEISKLSEGRFDVTWLGAGRLWDFKAEHPKVPAVDAIQQAITLIDYRKILLDEKASTVGLQRAGMKIGLGGIAKGYAVDQAAKVIRNRGFKHFAVNAGGDLYCKGRNGKNLWRVGIKNPRKLSENLAVLPVSNLAVVTSGDYERYFVRDGKRYSHIMDPTTGWPVDHCRSVTVMAKEAWRADALSTAIFVLGPEKGMALAESLTEVECVVIDSKGQATVSSGLK
jgi:thiamine biosynthesis lipoprotein